MGVFSRKKDQTESALPSPSRPASARSPKSRNEPAASDALELDRRRARRRLVGAIALAVGAVVFIPMIFDSEPAGTRLLSVSMPDKDSTFTTNLPERPVTGAAPTANVAAPAAQPPALAPVPAPATVLPEPSTALPAAAAGGQTQAAGSGVSAAPGPNVSAASPGSPGTSRPASAATVAPTPAQSASIPSSEAAAPKSTEKDDPRAVAALEGKVIDPTPNKVGGAAGAGNFAVQIGAFSTSEKIKERVKELREKLTAAGLKTYTEELDTPQGPRTRLRVGPYATHDAAEKAREKVRNAGLDGAIVPL